MLITGPSAVGQQFDSHYLLAITDQRSVDQRGRKRRKTGQGYLNHFQHFYWLSSKWYFIYPTPSNQSRAANVNKRQENLSFPCGNWNFNLRSLMFGLSQLRSHFICISNWDERNFSVLWCTSGIIQAIPFNPIRVGWKCNFPNKPKCGLVILGVPMDRWRIQRCGSLWK